TDPLLGEGYETHRIDLGADDEGPLVATLIHREAGPDAAARADRPPVLLMHGWSDYVLDRGLMEHLGRRGHDVWGLDLRKHGRSLLPGQTPTEIDHLSRYDAEIGAALRRLGRALGAAASPHRPRPGAELAVARDASRAGHPGPRRGAGADAGGAPRTAADPPSRQRPPRPRQPPALRRRLRLRPRTEAAGRPP